MRSVARRIDERGGKMYVPRAMYSFKMSFCVVPATRSAATPWRLAIATYIAKRIAGVVAHLRRQIERDGETRLAVLEEIAVSRVGFLGRAEPRVLAHRPEPPPIHRGLDATRVRGLARKSRIGAIRIEDRGQGHPVRG